jgi:hypothetical protein
MKMVEYNATQNSKMHDLKRNKLDQKEEERK